MRNSVVSRLGTRLAAAAIVGLAGLHCGADVAADPSSNDDSDDASDPSKIEEVASPLVVPEHCWAQIEQPKPNVAIMQVGTQLTLRTDPTLRCPDGMGPEAVAYRYYVEGPNGRVGNAQGPTEWNLRRLVPFDTTGLAPGRYKIYVYTLPQSMIADWQAEDPIARNTSKRSGNAWIELVTPTWTPSWNACSTVCATGTQTRASVGCLDHKARTQPSDWCAGSPPDATTQACTNGCAALASNTLEIGGQSRAVTAAGSTTTFLRDSVSYPLYKLTGTFDGTTYEIGFATKPTAEGDYTARSTYPTVAGEASLSILNNRGSSLRVVAPSSIAGTTWGGTGQFGAQTYDVTADVFYAGAGCNATDYTGIAGKIALVDREPLSGAGACSVGTKLNRAMANGAGAFVLVNLSTTPTQYVNVTGSLPSFTIPFASTTWNAAAALKTEIANAQTVNIQLQRSDRAFTVSPTSEKIRVRLDGDNKLHALVDDAFLPFQTGTDAVRIDALIP